jgi:hypothetical protein
VGLVHQIEGGALLQKKAVSTDVATVTQRAKKRAQWNPGERLK